MYETFVVAIVCLFYFLSKSKAKWSADSGDEQGSMETWEEGRNTCSDLGQSL